MIAISAAAAQLPSALLLLSWQWLQPQSSPALLLFLSWQWLQPQSSSALLLFLSCCVCRCRQQIEAQPGQEGAVTLCSSSFPSSSSSFSSSSPSSSFSSSAPSSSEFGVAAGAGSKVNHSQARRVQSSSSKFAMMQSPSALFLLLLLLSLVWVQVQAAR